MNIKKVSSHEEFLRILASVPNFRKRIGSVAQGIRPSSTDRMIELVSRIETLLSEHHLDAYFMAHEQRQVRQALSTLMTLNDRMAAFSEYHDVRGEPLSTVFDIDSLANDDRPDRRDSVAGSWLKEPL